MIERMELPKGPEPIDDEKPKTVTHRSGEEEKKDDTDCNKD
jgi:hypothetical protein